MVNRDDVAWLLVLGALVLGGCLSILLVSGGGFPPTAEAADKDCADFNNQRKAQRFFHKHHPHQDPHGLDADNDGKACDTLPCPCSGRRWKEPADTEPVGTKVAPTQPFATKSISSTDALDETFRYAKRICYDHGSCRKYAASRCLRHDGGVSCYAWNYADGPRYGKFHCRRLVFWKSHNNHKFLSPWRCFRGWNEGPG